MEKRTPAAESGIDHYGDLQDPLRALARQILDERERRNWYLPKAAFGECAWEMLLLLYASDTQALSSETLFNATLTTPTNGRRWIDFLQNEGLATITGGLRDESRAWVELTPEGLYALELYLSDRLQRTQSGTGYRHAGRFPMSASILCLAKVVAAVAAAVIATAIVCTWAS